MDNQRKNFAKQARGFSLVELMLVVAIIGLLVSLAQPRFERFVSVARQQEAKMNLGAIFALQQAYHGANDQYYPPLLGSGTLSQQTSPGDPNCAQTNDLGFHVSNCVKSRYSYATMRNSADSSQFIASAYERFASTNRPFSGLPFTIADVSARGVMMNCPMDRIVMGCMAACTGWPPAPYCYVNQYSSGADLWVIDQSHELTDLNSAIAACY